MKALMFLLAAGVVVFIGELAHLQLLASLWIPLAMLLFLIGFPLFAVVGKSSLFWGLFDLDLSPKKGMPIRHFVVTLSSFAVAGSAMSILDLALRRGPERMGIPGIQESSPWLVALYHALIQVTGGQLVLILAGVNAITAYFAGFAIATSWNQARDKRPLPTLIAGVASGLVAGNLAVWALLKIGTPLRDRIATETRDSWFVHWLGPGYEQHWDAHLAAAMVSFLALGLYIVLGFYGKRALGKVPTVAALVGPLMVLVVLGWCGSAMQFFLSRWHIPLLLVVAVLGWINGMLPWADHKYALVPRDLPPPASPYKVFTANNRNCAILVASAGGGIQAAAWTAKVLQELRGDLKDKNFDRALCFISSISGGSMGSACYVDWLKRGAPSTGPNPFVAASASSLDEVAWGMAWPDLLRVLLPFPIKMDRAEAMERAWVGNLGTETLNAPLSSWNGMTANGDLPALIMNSTMVEVGGPLLLGTSDAKGGPERTSNVWWDGDKLHVYNGSKLDIPVVRGARLSATFPFVTPAARPSPADHAPHMMDGGFYDNFGMATLTEWIDQALEEQAKDAPGKEQVKRVLVLQINGFPRAKFDPPQPPKGRGGWLTQLIDPILVLINVRTAGQVSHRDVELALLEDKWRARGIHIEHVNFELEKADAPLSWHLMPKQKQDIADAWNTSNDLKVGRQRVKRFLDECPRPLAIGEEEVLVATKAHSSV